MFKLPNKPAAPNPAIASRLDSGHHWCGVGEPERPGGNITSPMNTIMEKLIGKDVTVTLLSTYLVKGKLTQCDDTFLVVEQEKGEAVIPLTSILQLVAAPVGAKR